MAERKGDAERFRQLEAVIVRAGDLVRTGAVAARVVPGCADPDNPTTDLDRRVDALLAEGLMGTFSDCPGVALVSEERADDLARLGAREAFIVDPIDGTRSLLLGTGEASVSVALWRDGDLEWGCVHNPFTHETFTAVRGGGAWLGARRLHVTTTPVVAAADFVMSRHEHDHGLLAMWDGRLRYRPVGSIAWKMALVAAGRADGTLTLHPRHEWDVAAGTLLVLEAGGRVTDAAGRDLAFNQRDLSLRGIVVTNGTIHAELLSMLPD